MRRNYSTTFNNWSTWKYKYKKRQRYQIFWHHHWINKRNDVTTYSELNAAKNDDLVNGDTEGQDQSRKLVSMENEVTTEKSTPKEQAEEGKEYTATMTKLTDDTIGKQITFIRELHTNKWFKIGEAVIKYLVLPLVLPFLICNIISFIVMNLQHNRTRSPCVYLAALAGSDSAVLLHSVMVWSQFKSPAWSNYMCKANVYMTHVIWTFSAFIIVAMSFDRCYAVVVPHSAKVRCTAKRARVTCGVLLLLVLIFYSPLIVFSGFDDTDLCVRYLLDTRFMTMYVYISLVVYPLVPFALIICLNCAILVTLWRRKHSGLAHSSTIDKIESQLTRMIVVVCVAYLILMCPFEVHGVYMYYARYQKNPEIVSKYFFTTYLFYLLGLLNSGINSLLYFCSSRNFRIDLKILFEMCCRRDNSD